LPNWLPLTLLVALSGALGVIGGVDSGSPPLVEPAAATLGTVPSVGVGLLAIMPAGVCMKDDCVATEEFEFERLRLVVLVEETGIAGVAGLVLEMFGVEIAVGVGTGEGWAEFEIEIAREGW